MSSIKRKMPPSGLLQRRVRPRYEPEPESDIDDLSEGPSEEEAGSFGSDDEGEEGEEGEERSEDGSGGDSDEDNSDAASGSEEENEAEEEEEEEDDGPQIDASQLSFGALAKAQAAMRSSSKSQRTSHAAAKDKEDEGYGHPTKLSSAKKVDKRSSKHAPVEVTSKKPVSRKRDFLTSAAETKKPQPRDPRFTPLGPGASAAATAGARAAGSAIDEIKARKAYAFLDEYRESEMRELRASIKKTRDAGQRERLQRALLSMESRKKAQERKDRERAVLEEHRRREKELVRQGKTPFYLKKSEQKKRVLVDQFQGMKKKQVDRAIERRRKKVAGKEKKMLPMTRRGAEDR